MERACTTRTVWLLAQGSLDGIILGPTLRVVQMARLAKQAGHEVVIALEDGREGRFEEMRTCRLTPESVRVIKPKDVIVAVATLHPAIFKAILGFRLGFDLDLYGLGALEHLEMDHPYTPRQVFQSRRRLRRRYRILSEHAERIYLSDPQQLAFLGGTIIADGLRSSAILASRLPEKSLLLPMGVPASSPGDSPSPFPSRFADRPVFLWGGGIWSWFDIDTLLEAFRILRDRGSPAALFFICGSNPSKSAAHDGPVRRALETSRDLGLLDSNVAFHQTGVLPSDLPAYLQHCAAAVMSNPRRLESLGSWRTRLLDPLAYGKPVVTAGYDPLSDRLAGSGAALVSPSGDAGALADQIDRFCGSPKLRETMSDASRREAKAFSWSAIFAPWVARIADPEAYQKTTLRPNPIRLLQFLFGI